MCGSVPLDRDPRSPPVGRSAGEFVTGVLLLRATMPGHLPGNFRASVQGLGIGTDRAEGM